MKPRFNAHLASLLWWSASLAGTTVMAVVLHGGTLQAGSVVSRPSIAVPAEDDVTVTGCLERDAAATMPIFLLTVDQPTKATYHLRGPEELKSHLGKTVRVTGPLERTTSGGREEWLLTVRRYAVVASSC